MSEDKFYKIYFTENNKMEFNPKVSLLDRIQLYSEDFIDRVYQNPHIQRENANVYI